MTVRQCSFSAKVFAFLKGLQFLLLVIHSFRRMTIYKYLSRILCTFSRVKCPRFVDHFIVKALGNEHTSFSKMVLPGGTIDVKVFYQYHYVCFVFVFVSHPDSVGFFLWRTLTFMQFGFLNKIGIYSLPCKKTQQIIYNIYIKYIIYIIIYILYFDFPEYSTLT